MGKKLGEIPSHLPRFFCVWGPDPKFKGNLPTCGFLRYRWVCAVALVRLWWKNRNRGFFFAGGEIPVVFRVGIHDCQRTCCLIEKPLYDAHFSPPPIRGEDGCTYSLMVYDSWFWYKVKGGQIIRGITFLSKESPVSKYHYHADGLPNTNERIGYIRKMHKNKDYSSFQTEIHLLIPYKFNFQLNTAYE